jgi:hypothetical protein
MAAKKRAIEARVGHTQGLDDIGKGIIKFAEKTANKVHRGKVYMKVRKELKREPDKVIREIRKDMYLPAKKGTYANPYSSKALPKSVKKNVLKGMK